MCLKFLLISTTYIFHKANNSLLHLCLQSISSCFLVSQTWRKYMCVDKDQDSTEKSNEMYMWKHPCVKSKAVFHNQGFTLCVNPKNCQPNFKWFAVLFLQIELIICRFIGKLYTLLLIFLIKKSEICISVYEMFWIKLKPD